MNEADNKIIDKIEKLIALSSSDNENEAKAAMLKAQELMAKYAPGSRFCNLCGAPLTKQTCPSCGGDITAGSKFCPHCGKPLE